MNECRTFTIPELSSTVTLPVDRYWGGGIWGLYYWDFAYWGSPGKIIYGVPIERTYVIGEVSRKVTISEESRTIVVSNCN
jgi:hypothetical protein